MKIAIHQPNFIPWLPFFYKMSLADKFVILGEVKFEKNNFQNRYFLNTEEKWVTKSVNNKSENIIDKTYTDGQSLIQLNIKWIDVIKNTLNINTEIVYDFPTDKTKTERLIELVKNYGGDTYITCPEAKDKYLDEELMRSEGINIEYYDCPRHLRIHIFEAFEKFGIDGTVKHLPKREYAIA